MKVIEYEPNSWMLLDDKGTLYLEINATLGEVKLSLLIKLNDIERDDYRQLGRDWIGYLASRVQQVPCLYFGRNESMDLQKRVGEVIFKWKRDGSPLPSKPVAKE